MYTLEALFILYMLYYVVPVLVILFLIPYKRGISFKIVESCVLFLGLKKNKQEGILVQKMFCSESALRGKESQ